MPSMAPTWRNRRHVSRSPRRQQQLVIVDLALQVAQPRAVARVALEISAVALERPPVGVRVVLVDGIAKWREAAGEKRLSQAVRGQRQIRGHAEPAEALPEHAPALHAELPPDPLGVADDRISSEMREVVRLLLRAHPGEGSDRRRAARSALIEHQHAELPQGPVEPRPDRWGCACGRGASDPGPALEVDEKRPIPTLGVGDLAGEHRDPRTASIVVIEWDLERVLDRDQSRK